jgi:hypothetical protein
MMEPLNVRSWTTSASISINRIAGRPLPASRRDTPWIDR